MHRNSDLQISEREAETTSSKAAKAEFSKSYDQAFRLYIKAAEQFLHLSRSSSAEDRSKQKWKSSAANALERAERIKRFVEALRSGSNATSNSSGPPTNDLRLTPIGVNYFSPQEQYYILKKGATVNGLVFPAWEEPVHVNKCDTIYADPDGQPSLSPEQHKVAPVWRRPSPKGLANLKDADSCRPVLPQEILQCVVTDCSVCASLSVCLEHCRRFGSKYMKLMGGYDFPGSNSSIDLHLAGWIPESAFERERAWDRVERGFSSGQCVVTLGTGPSSYIRWRDIPLLPSHSYAVIDIYETEEGRLLTVIDSWVRSNGSKDEPSRILHIPWTEVLNTFEGVYLSWDPSIWQTTLIFHSMWKRSAADEAASRQTQIEFNCSSDLDEEIWVLLTRHVVDARRSTDFIALRVELEDDFAQDTDVVKNQRILSGKGTYTNSTHILARTRIPKSLRSGILSILASYEGDFSEVGYTLTAYSMSTTKIMWVENNSDPPFTSKIEGSFTAKNAGGNCTYPSFMVNPQYLLTIHPMKLHGGANVAANRTCKLTLGLRSNKDMPVNMALVWSEGRRVTELSVKDIVATSGAYSYGLARLTKSVSPGEYTLVASGFEPHHMGPFSLHVESSLPFDLKPIPNEGAGMYSKLVRGSWDSDTAAGAPSFGQYSKNPVFELEVPSTTQLMIRLQLLQPSTPNALNVTVYSNSQNNIKASLGQRHIATSGAYDDTIAGVATPQTTLGVGKYYMVPSTYNPGTQAAFRMVVYSSISNIRVTPVQGTRI
ncbi:hypothetical protein CPB84DRAFT_1845125 [Gymnopilus junonius]|uniref:Calpain catalytic domain-containing protein n=1 Tax=Gymnopilus junonius TaxID=109634 RepID=A0A9P5NUE0_GYMJU|nr:hypothetical protein CPB84DRAFT_1845125 [Gymnopilus junonius]